MAFSLKFAKDIRIQGFIAACLNLCEVINGYGVAWAGPVFPKFDDPDQSPLPYRITEVQKSWIASFIFFGYIGAFSAGYLANLIGRKKSIMLGGVLNLAMYVLLARATNLLMIYLGRFMVGTTISFLTVSEIMYIGEVSSPKIRGVIMASMGVFHAIGSLLVYCIGPFVSYASVNYVAIALNLAFIFACRFLPESPLFFILKDDEDSARNTLLQLGRGANMENELKTMLEKVRDQKNNKHIWKELFKLKCNRKSLLISVSLIFLQQCSGIMVVIMYANTIFRNAGSAIQPDVASIVVGAMFVIGAVIAPTFIDKYGRRILLLISAGGLSVTMALLGVYLYLMKTSPASVERLGWLPLMLLVIAVFVYSFGLSIVPNTMLGELFTSRVRGLGTPISFCSGFISAVLFLNLYGYISIHLNFWLFAFCNSFTFVFVIFVVPETMGKSLIEIQEMLEK